MDLLVVSLRGPTLADRRGGAQDYIRAVASRWVRDGHRVRLVCAQERLPDGQMLPPRETVDGIEVERVGTPERRVVPLREAAGRMAVGMDAVVENIMAFPLGLPVTLPKGTPLVAVKHHFQGATFVRAQGRIKGTAGRVLESVVQPALYRRVPLVVPSAMTAAHVRRQWPRHRAPLAVIPPPVSLPTVPEERPGGPPTVVYVGALHLARKRVDDLLDAWETVRSRVPEARLHIAGDGPDRAALEARAGEGVTFHGFVTDERKAELLAQAWAFASPSLHEGFGITWIEAGAMGVPVVGYRVPGLDTITDDCAVLVEPGDVDGLTQGLVSVLTDDAERARLSARARANALRFDPDAAARAFLDVIEMAVQSRSGR